MNEQKLYGIFVIDSGNPVERKLVFAAIKEAGITFMERQGYHSEKEAQAFIDKRMSQFASKITISEYTFI